VEDLGQALLEFIVGEKLVDTVSQKAHPGLAQILGQGPGLARHIVIDRGEIVEAVAPFVLASDAKAGGHLRLAHPAGVGIGVDGRDRDPPRPDQGDEAGKSRFRARTAIVFEQPHGLDGPAEARVRCALFDRLVKGLELAFDHHRLGVGISDIHVGQGHEIKLVSGEGFQLHPLVEALPRHFERGRHLDRGLDGRQIELALVGPESDIVEGEPGLSIGDGDDRPGFGQAAGMDLEQIFLHQSAPLLFIEKGGRERKVGHGFAGPDQLADAGQRAFTPAVEEAAVKTPFEAERVDKVNRMVAMRVGGADEEAVVPLFQGHRHRKVVPDGVALPEGVIDGFAVEDDAGDGVAAEAQDGLPVPVCDQLRAGVDDLGVPDLLRGDEGLPAVPGIQVGEAVITGAEIEPGALFFREAGISLLLPAARSSPLLVQGGVVGEVAEADGPDFKGTVGQPGLEAAVRPQGEALIGLRRDGKNQDGEKKIDRFHRWLSYFQMTENCKQ